MNVDFQSINSAIGRADEAARGRARERWNSVAKPIGGLGEFERMVEQIAALTGSEDVRIGKRCAIVMCADNGVVAQGVTQTDASVTRSVAESIARGASSICSMARPAGVNVLAVDIGMAQPAHETGVADLHVARGTGDISRGPAMGRDRAEEAIEKGIGCARRAASAGYRIIAVGEMGIGNTTTASALACALLGLAPEEAVGRGAGLSSAGLARKVAAVKRALRVNAPQGGRAWSEDPLYALQALGGFDIAGMAGLYLGCALSRTPAIVDGAISAIAALIAVSLCPACRCALLPSHLPSEPYARAVLDGLDLECRPVLQAGMHLGEATGAVCLMPLLDMALSLYNGTTFEQTGIAAYEADLS